jgi:hypothetical protein
MKLIKITSKKDFNKYSNELKSFESSFKYPLGDSSFTISHGIKHSYFSFFERLGKVNFFLVIDKNKVVAAGCAILKKISQNGVVEKYWYLGDFKITKEYQNKNILNKILLKYLLFQYLKSNKMIAINMSPINKNPLIRKVKNLFKRFNVKFSKYFFYEWETNAFLNHIANNEYIKNNFLLFTNNNHKDIIINDKQIPLYHLVDKAYGLANYPNLVAPIDSLTTKTIHPDTLFMFGTSNESKINKLLKYNIKSTSESTIISHKINIKKSDFFTGEI